MPVLAVRRWSDSGPIEQTGAALTVTLAKAPIAQPLRKSGRFRIFELASDIQRILFTTTSFQPARDRCASSRHPLTVHALHPCCQMIPTTTFTSQALVAAAFLVVTSALYSMWFSNSKKWDPRGKVIFVCSPSHLRSRNIFLYSIAS